MNEVSFMNICIFEISLLRVASLNWPVWSEGGEIGTFDQHHSYNTCCLHPSSYLLSAPLTSSYWKTFIQISKIVYMKAFSGHNRMEGKVEVPCEQP